MDLLTIFNVPFTFCCGYHDKQYNITMGLELQSMWLEFYYTIFIYLFSLELLTWLLINSAVGWKPILKMILKNPTTSVISDSSHSIFAHDDVLASILFLLKY